MNVSTHYRRVPKTLKQNLEFRLDIQRVVNESRHYADELRAMCAEDFLFYVNTFCWAYEPRPGAGRTTIVPFITWPYQDKALLRLNTWIDIGLDGAVEKSKDMGATWMCMLAVHWRWMFRSMESFLVGSRKEQLVDSPNDPRTLFWKLDFLWANLPSWLQPPRSRTELMMQNLRTGSTVSGESTNQNFGRGDRRTAVVLDEFAYVENGFQILSATADVSDCRIFNSTPAGTNDAFYDRVKALPPEQKLRLHWTEHPEKSRGMYIGSGNKPRSPWYDLQCQRRTEQEVAQQLDIDYAGAAFQWFNPGFLASLERRDSKPPYGTIPTQQMVPELLTHGAVRLWCILDAAGAPAADRNYVVACDISAGTGSSNSAITVGDRRTGEKVAEYAWSRIDPMELAKVAVALATFFKGRHDVGAFLIWEANAYGRIFGKRVLELGYTNIYYKTDESGTSRKPTDIPGWHSTPDLKRTLLSEYREALGTRFINRSAEAIQECGQYITEPNGDISHAGSLSKADPTGARANHGDRVIADALCWKVMKDDGMDKKSVALEYDPPQGTLAYRIMLHKRGKEDDFWGRTCA